MMQHCACGCVQGDLGLEVQQLGMLQSAMLLGYLAAQARQLMGIV